ncbi:MAG: sirohydrochlorin chelatase [Streptosporangiaceae bacterium]|jgi:sirohydrochlorin ferrochelatase
MRDAVLVAVAHGSKDPRASATVTELAAVARERSPGLDLRTAFLGHAPPSLPQVLSTIEADREVTVLPLLLTAAFHSKTDIPRMLAKIPRARGSRVSYGATLGPHPLLLDALDRRLAEADPGAHADPGRTAVVLAAAGSSDPEANATIARLAAQWQARAGWYAVRPAYASAAEPSADGRRTEGVSPAAAVAGLRRDGAPRVAVATYLLAPGLFADRIRGAALAAGAAAVSPALGACAEVADILLDRFTEIGSMRRTAA